MDKPGAPFIPLIETFDNDYVVVDNDGSKFYVLTNAGVSNYKLAMFDLSNPKGGWVDIIPEQHDVMKSVSVGNNIFIVHYMKDATSVLKLYGKDGTFISDVKLESIGTVDQLSADKKDEHLFYGLKTFISPSVIYYFNLRTREQEVFFKPKMVITNNVGS